MYFIQLSLLALSLHLDTAVLAAPVTQLNSSNPNSDPIPGESSIYTGDLSKKPPWPGHSLGAVLNTTYGPPGKDDLLFQNLLSAEWIIFSFYQAGVESFHQSSFMQWPNTTYSRIREIRNDEAGHLRIFQDAISSTSVKPGPCKYEYGFATAEEFLALQTYIELSSMAFLTGLTLQAQLDPSKGPLMAIGQTESRHNTWSLIDIWNTDPFAGPSDTAFPYANQIPDLTNNFIVPASCPKENPEYPTPRQDLPQFTITKAVKSIAPGAILTLNFSQTLNQPAFKQDQDCFAVFFHGVHNISVPFDTHTNRTTVPKVFDDVGLIIAVISDKEGAPTKESVLAGPGVFLEQPSKIGVSLASI